MQLRTKIRRTSYILKAGCLVAYGRVFETFFVCCTPKKLRFHLGAPTFFFIAFSGALLQEF